MSKVSEGVAKFVDAHPTLGKLCGEAEAAVKKPLFGCKSCGQCVLSHNAFVCCMRCPKQIRNGPCGGTREDGHCEVYPEKMCIWFLIHKRSKSLGWQSKLRKIHKPVDRRLQDSSAWISMFAGRIEPFRFSRGERYAQEADREEQAIKDKLKKAE